MNVIDRDIKVIQYALIQAISNASSISEKKQFADTYKRLFGITVTFE